MYVDFSVGQRARPRDQFAVADGSSARAPVDRGLRCCARDRPATVPRNVRNPTPARAVRINTGRLPICMAHTSGFYFRLAAAVCVRVRAAVCAGRVCAARSTRRGGCS
ncbi:unnamed protein product, partial [Iphiclides podalirius]